MQPAGGRQWRFTVVLVATVATMVLLPLVIMLAAYRGDTRGLSTTNGKAPALRAYLNKTTGKLRPPTMAEMQVLSRRSKSGEPHNGVATVIHRDGMTLVRIPASRRVHETARLSSTGAIVADGIRGDE